MKTLRRGLFTAASVIASLAMLSSPALAAGNGSGGGGGAGGGSGGSGGSGSDTGSAYADLNFVLRDANGVPILKTYVVPATAETAESTENCVQPVSYSPIPGVTSSTNPVDGRTVWVVPLQGQWIANPPDPLPVAEIAACDAQPQYAMFVSAVDLARLNMSRTTETVVAQKLASVQQKLQLGTDIALESTGRISIDGVPIDAPPENAAIYGALMNTGTIPGLPASMAGPPAAIGPAPTGPDSNSRFDAMELAAMAIGATADKGTPLSVDAVEYYNQVIGFPSTTLPTWGVKFITSAQPDSKDQTKTVEKQYVDYSGFSYNRSQTFKGSVTWLDVPTLTWKVSRITDVVPFTNLSSYPSIGDRTLYGVTAFAQLADDVRALCNFIPDNTYIPGYYMDVPGADTTAAQLRALTDPAVDIAAVPADVFETYPFQMTASLLNPFAGALIDGARLRITVQAPGALSADDVTATATDGQTVPFAATGSSLTGWWGPEQGFPVGPGYNQSTTFDVTVAGSAPTGDYKVTLDLVQVGDPSQVLATDSATITVQPNQLTVLWGDGVPRLATQDVAMAIPLRVYSPAAGSGQLHLTVTGPQASKAGDLSIYASNGTDMVAMPLALDAQSNLVGTWNVTLNAGFTDVIWYATVSAAAAVGSYSFAVSLQDANTLQPILVSVAAPESHGQKPPDSGGGTGTGEDKTAPVVTLTPVGTPGSTATFNVTADEQNVTFTYTLYLNDVAGEPQTLTSSPLSLTGLVPGNYLLSVVGKDKAGNTSVEPAIYRWTVGSSSQPPTSPTSGVAITSSSSATLTAGTPAVFAVTTSGTVTPKLTLLGNLPAGVTFIDNGDGTATLGGIPAAGTAGTYPLTILASDGTYSATQDFVLTVVAEPAVSPGQPTSEPAGYWMVGRDGGVFTFGPGMAFYGSTGGVTLHEPVVGMAATPGGHGYWLVASDGGVFAFGDARFYGSTGGVTLSRPVVGMAATPSGHGYWLVASDGGVFAFGDARFHGSTGGMTLREPVVGMASPDPGGYWLVAADGGIFAFGDAAFHGSTGGIALTRPIVGMGQDRRTGGYWLVAADGGIFSFNAPFYGSAGGMTLKQPIVGAASAA